jgi:hypothetical protein
LGRGRPGPERAPGAGAREYADRLLAGDYVLGVFVGRDDGAKARAAEAMRASGGDFINYYADTYVESL